MADTPSNSNSPTRGCFCFGMALNTRGWRRLQPSRGHRRWPSGASNRLKPVTCAVVWLGPVDPVAASDLDGGEVQGKGSKQRTACSAALPSGTMHPWLSVRCVHPSQKAQVARQPQRMRGASCVLGAVGKLGCAQAVRRGVQCAQAVALHACLSRYAKPTAQFQAAMASYPSMHHRCNSCPVVSQRTSSGWARFWLASLSCPMILADSAGLV